MTVPETRFASLCTDVVDRDWFLAQTAESSGHTQDLSSLGR